MIGRDTFQNLDLAFKVIMQIRHYSGGVSLLVSFLPVNQRGVFMKPSKESYRSFNG